MQIVLIEYSTSSYGAPYSQSLYGSDGTKSLGGIDFGDVECGVQQQPRWFYVRHDGTEKIYQVGFYIKPVGLEWGGFVNQSPDATLPYNPNYFRTGGINPDTLIPYSSTDDYNFMRLIAFNNPEMGVRLHLNRQNVFERTNGLGFMNQGLQFSAIPMPETTLDFSEGGTYEIGSIFPKPSDPLKLGKVGDEMKFGMSLYIPEETIGSGHIQYTMAIRYRYTL